MGIFDWFSDSDSEKTKSQTTLPAWQTAAQKDAVTAAQKLVHDRTYTPYTLPRIADFSPDQQAGFQATRDAANVYQPSLNAAQNMMMGIGSAPLNGNQYTAATGNAQMQDPAAQFNSAAASQYMNPYIENVVNNSVRQLNDQRARDQLQLDSNSVKAGAFGGSRRAVGQQELNRNYGNQMNDMTANLYSQGFNNAQGQFNADRSATLGVNTANQNASNQFGLANLGFQNQAFANNQNAYNTGVGQQLQAATGLAGIAGQQQAQGLAGANALQGIGAQQQALNQQGLNLAKDDFDAQKNFAYDQIKFLSDITNGTASGNQTTTSSTPGVSNGSSVLGAGLGLASLYSMLSGG